MNSKNVFEIVNIIITTLVIPIILDVIKYSPKKSLFTIKDERYNKETRNYLINYLLPMIVTVIITELYHFKLLSGNKVIYTCTVIAVLIIAFMFNLKINIRSIRECVKYIMYPACLMIALTCVTDSEIFIYSAYIIFLIAITIFMYNLNKVYSIGIKKLDSIKIIYKDNSIEQNVIFYKQQKEVTVLHILNNDKIKVKTIKNDEIAEKIEIYK